MAEKNLTDDDPTIMINLDDSLYDMSLQNLEEECKGYGIVHSLTTDTLDSVALGPSPSEENLQMLASVADTDEICVKEDGISDVNSIQDKMSSEDELQVAGDVIRTGDHDKLPSLQSYFTSTNDADDAFYSFDAITTDGDDNDKDITSNIPSYSEDKKCFEDLPGVSMSLLQSAKNDATSSKTTEGCLEADLPGGDLLSELEESLRKDTEKHKHTEDYDRIHQTRKVSETEVVDFLFGDESVNTNVEQTLIAESATDELNKKENFEHFTAEGDEYEGLENLSVSPRLSVFIPPPPARQNSGSSNLPINAHELGSIHSPNAARLLSPVHRKGSSSKERSGQSPLDDTESKDESIFIGEREGLTSYANDDAFTASILMSDRERRQDAWLPSEATRQLLLSVITSLPNSSNISEEQLCYPAIVVTETQSDPVRELVERYMGETEARKRRVMSIDVVPPNEKGLGKLIEAGSYWAALNLTGQLLTSSGQGVEMSREHYQHTPSTLQLWLCRFKLYLKLHMYNSADMEMKAFGNMDTPDLYYEYYPTLYPGRRGSMVPFSLRVLHAELPHYMGRTQEALDRLYFIQSVIHTVILNLTNGLAEDGREIEISSNSRLESLTLWREREVKTLYVIGNTLLAIKDYAAALSVYEELLERDPSSQSQLHSGMGRIYIQMGSALMAKSLFNKALQGKRETASDVDKLINKGLLCMCEANYPDAWQSFSQAVAMNPLNIVAINNMAVCALYMGKLKEALTTLENLVQQNPEKNLQEGVLFNLCTLYELESTRAIEKKQSLLQLVSRYKGDGFSLACLKMA